MIDYTLESDLKYYNQSRYKAFKEGINFETNEKYERLLNARYCKVSRIKKRVVFLFSYCSYVYFCTFTFDNNTLKKCDRTKRDLIKNTLNNFSTDIHYILNVDYGKKGGREHYHCIVGTNSTHNLRDYLKKEYPFLSGCDRVSTKADDLKRVSKYLNKLTNHCIKDTTKNKRIVYNFPCWYDVFKDIGKQRFILDSYKLGL